MGPDVRSGPETSEETTRLVRRWHWRRWLVVVFILALIFVLSGATTWIRDGLAWPLTLNQTLQKSDVIIVLGSGTREKPPHLPPQAQQRVAKGIELYQQGWAPEIIMSGGLDKKTKEVEATEMLAYAASLGFPVTSITPEGYSKDTVENAKNSLAIMAEHGWQTALVVTSPYHTRRSCFIFRHQKANVRCVAAPFSLVPANSFAEHLWDTRSVIREYGAIIYNFAKGQL